MNWVHLHLDQKLDVPTLAARARLSERTFFRKFRETMGDTPAHLIESLRLDAARVLLSQGLAVKLTAARVGLPGARFAHAFERRFGVSPRQYRQSHWPSVGQKPARRRSSVSVSRTRRSIMAK
jgi:transcriptional regulator GlxA family with amidase domain